VAGTMGGACDKSKAWPDLDLDQDVVQKFTKYFVVCRERTGVIY